ncbi:MAG: hypothetical protein QM673_05305 [Gordonia sp. (in: high G+C Gram-positive bacteria)]
MLVTSIDAIDLDGTLVELIVEWVGNPEIIGAPVSFNQGNHIRAHRERSTASAWIAATVDLAMAGQHVDEARAARAVARLLAEQDALRARMNITDISQDVFSASQIVVTSAEPRQVTTASLRAELDRRCRPGAVPGVFFGVLGHTLVCAFDHAHADAFTIDLVLRRIAHLYEHPDAPPRVGASYIERCRAEEALHRSPGAGYDDAVEVWRTFFDACGGGLPPCPLDLDAGEGDRQHTLVAHLADDAQISALGPKTFALTLAALATVIHEGGGPAQLAALIPVHTRGGSQSPWHHTAGWLVTNAPVLVPAGDVDAAVRALHQAVEISEVPLDYVLARCQPTIPGRDLFMISYIDYRRCGPQLPNARHISATGTTDTAQLWFSRTHRGLDLRVRFPATAVAERSVNSVVTRLGELLRSQAAAGAPPSFGGTVTERVHSAPCSARSFSDAAAGSESTGPPSRAL